MLITMWSMFLTQMKKIMMKKIKLFWAVYLSLPLCSAVNLKVFTDNAWITLPQSRALKMCTFLTSQPQNTPSKLNKNCFFPCTEQIISYRLLERDNINKPELQNIFFQKFVCNSKQTAVYKKCLKIKFMC